MYHTSNFGQIYFFYMFIQSHFDFSFSFKDVFFGFFEYPKENIGKYKLINLFPASIADPPYTQNMQAA